MDKVEAVDPTAQIVTTTEPAHCLRLSSSIATGARHAYFGHDEWEEAAPGLKTIGDATEIRARILAAFEKAEVTEDPELRRKLLTFVVVGGGPTGVELAGAIIELARKAIVPGFPQYRFVDRQGRAGRGRRPAAGSISRKPVAVGEVATREARRRGEARRCRDAVRRRPA